MLAMKLLLSEVNNVHKSENPSENRRTTIVLIAVATLESVFLIPILARIAVIPANTAEPKANKTHINPTLRI